MSDNLSLAALSPTETTRERIKNTAAALFANCSYPTTSLASIAKSCEVSKSLIYHYYRDKAEILFDIANGHVQRLLYIVNESKTMPFSNSSEELGYLISEFMREYETSSNCHSVLVQDLKFLPPEKSELIRSAERKIVDHFTTLITLAKDDALETRPAVMRALTMLLFGMMNWTFTWLDPKGTLSFEEVGLLIKYLFIGALSGQDDSVSLLPKLL